MLPDIIGIPVDNENSDNTVAKSSNVDLNNGTITILTPDGKRITLKICFELCFCKIFRTKCY